MKKLILLLVMLCSFCLVSCDNSEKTNADTDKQLHYLVGEWWKLV